MSKPLAAGRISGTMQHSIHCILNIQVVLNVQISLNFNPQFLGVQLALSAKSPPNTSTLPAHSR
jgi:hypothetical protein